MARHITNDKCSLYHTEYCDLLNMQTCESCHVNETKEYDQALEDMRVLKELLPEDGVHDLFSGDACVLCKKEPRGRKEYFGLVDLGHPEPRRKKRSVIGVKVDCKVGSLVPIQLGTCKKCRNRMLLLEYLPILLPLITGLLTLIVLILPGVSDSMERIGTILPFALFAVLVLLSLAVAGLLKRVLKRRYADVMAVDPFEIPKLSKMRENGWFPLSTSGNAVRIVFTRKRMAAGAGTGTPEEALADRQAMTDR